MEEKTERDLQIRVHGSPQSPELVYLPGIHGDWTLIPSFRAAVAGHARFVEVTYPRRLDWNLADYARAVARGLEAHDVAEGWLLGESFGSQVIWPLLGGQFVHRRFRALGVILAGGFVRYPGAWKIAPVRSLCGGVPLSWLAGFLKIYARYARFRHRHAPETLASIHEFVARRTEADRRAICHRLELVRAADPRAIAGKIRLPLYHLAGAIDPVVAWWRVRPWLARHCPGYRASRIVWPADHNVLSTAPRESARQILEWMRAGPAP